MSFIEINFHIDNIQNFHSTSFEWFFKDHKENEEVKQVKADDFLLKLIAFGDDLSKMSINIFDNFYPSTKSMKMSEFGNSLLRKNAESFWQHHV